MKKTIDARTIRRLHDIVDLTVADIPGIAFPAEPNPLQGKPMDEELYRRALEVVRTTKRASTSHLQRRMGIGYNIAARLIDLLEARGVIGPMSGTAPREILSP